jgi:hypothetical protein
MPLDACNCQTLLNLPGVIGATMFMVMLMVSPGAAAGMG